MRRRCDMTEAVEPFTAVIGRPAAGQPQRQKQGFIDKEHAQSDATPEGPGRSCLPVACLLAGLLFRGRSR
jgi:hypothetical protein